MALEIMRDDVKIIQGLSDYPNQEEGLTSGEMKAKFDEAAVKLQGYINNSVVPAVNDKLSASEMAGAVADAVEQTLGSITPDKIGAAPAGYGLGTTGVVKTISALSELDTIVSNGWYTIYSPNVLSIGGVAFHSLTLEVSMYNSTQGCQTVRFLGNNIVCRRAMYSSEWGDWEFANPPMEIGVAYRTTERYNGKPVYVMACDFGALPNKSSKYANFGGFPTAIISAHGFTSAGKLLPWNLGSDNVKLNVLVFAPYHIQICVETNVDISGETAYVIVKYLKD